MKAITSIAALLFVFGSAGAQQAPTAAPAANTGVSESRAAAPAANTSVSESRAAAPAANPDRAAVARETQVLLRRANDLARLSSAESPVTLLRFAPDDQKVSVSLKDVSIADGLKVLFGVVKRGYVIDSDLPAGRKVTLVMDDVPFIGVLNLLTQAADVGWTREVQVSADGHESKVIYRIWKAPMSGATSSDVSFSRGRGLSGGMAAPPSDFVLGLAGQQSYGRGVGISALSVSPQLGNPYVPGSPQSVTYSAATTERISMFVCPHCHRTVSMVRAATQPKCPKCGRTFQSNWQFCPVDGTKRPADPTTWRFCPLCGKPVEVEKAQRAGGAVGGSISPNDFVSPNRPARAAR